MSFLRGKARLICAAALALLGAWRLTPFTSSVGASLASSALALVVFAGLWLLMGEALKINDRRLNTAAYIVGLVLSCMWTAGRRLVVSGTLAPWSAAGWLSLIADALIYGAVFGAAIALAYKAALAFSEKAAKKSGLFGRLIGNGWLAWLFLLICWAPVWLAFFPGTYKYDSSTQFYMYMDECYSANHPLLHTLFVGFFMALGVDAGDVSLGIALHCGLQMLIVSGVLAYSCRWLYKKGVPTGIRAAVLLLFALLPLYPLWSFSMTKDVLFGAFVLLTALMLIDLLSIEGAMRSPLRIAGFILSAVLMMHTRNNGVYAFALFIPFAVIFAKNRRIRTAVISLAALALFVGSNAGLKLALDAESADLADMASIPLQQIGRAAKLAPDSLSDEDWKLLDEYYPEAYIDEVYTELIADAVKWNIDYDAFESEPLPVFELWLKLVLKEPGHYIDAFMIQNLPFYSPEAKMYQGIELGINAMELYPVNEAPILPGLREPYQRYAATLDFLGLPGIELLSNTALILWACVALTGFFAYRRDCTALAACVLLLAIWASNLLGPVSIMRYMLGFFDCVPVLAAYALSRKI